jgi:hypothetical protein
VAVLSCPISHFRGGVLIATCPQCREHREVLVALIEDAASDGSNGQQRHQNTCDPKDETEADVPNCAVHL